MSTPKFNAGAINDQLGYNVDHSNFNQRLNALERNNKPNRALAIVTQPPQASATTTAPPVASGTTPSAPSAPPFAIELAGTLQTPTPTAINFDATFNGSGTSPLTVTVPTMTASGTGHQGGLVPDPGASAGTTDYLRQDATFANPLSGGISVTIVTAQLTTLGTQGSMTFVNGILTAQIAAT